VDNPRTTDTAADADGDAGVHPRDHALDHPFDHPFDHRGRVVLVTGGTRGIGRGISAAYIDAGATVVVCGRTPPEGADAGTGEDGAGGPVTTSPDVAAPVFVACDVRDPDQVASLLDGIVARFGRLDVAVNNAGGAPTADAATASPRFNEKVIALNLVAPFTVAQAANRVMQAQPGGGSVVNIASLSGVRPSPGAAAYGAAKAGLLSLTGTLAVEWAPKVRVNAVVAGIIATEDAHRHYGDDAVIDRIAATIPARRLGTPADVAGACLYLSSGAASFVTGATLEVHGGDQRPSYLDALPDR
jgi:NAD(P)-dependent dehydrogenase (short-subunit alcohol dehydrogenase family)